MSLANRQFKNNQTGEIIRVIDSFEDIAILENKQKVSASSLSDTNQYTELIDPANFFSNQVAYNALAEKIKNIPTHMLKDENGSIDVEPTSIYEGFGPVSNESAIVMSSEEDEMAELARKYGASMDSTEGVQKQNEAFARILGEEGSEELPKIPQQIQKVEVQRESVSMPVNSELQRPTSIEDPIITMFKRTKRNVEFRINVEISDKIPRLDFIEMMEDSYEISMIDFLAEEFTNKILQDPSAIRETIKNKIKQLVYGAPTTLSSNFNTTNKEKKETKKDSKNIQTVNDQITDSVTQVEKHEPISFEKEPVLSKDLPKKTTTRKPRAKKETVEK